MKNVLMLLCVLPLIGCAALWDAPKNIVGFSTRSLEAARVNASYQSYAASQEDIFRAVLDISVKEKYNVFMKDEIRGMIVVMGIPGAVDTTEVGIFITQTSKPGVVKVELSSRSSPAKRTVALAVLNKLGELFKAVTP